MAIQHLSYEDWYSTLLGQHFTSRAAAEHYERLDRLRSAREAGEREPSAPDKLSTEDLKKVAEEFIRRANENAGLPDQKAAAEKFCDEHPEFISEGSKGERNGNSMTAYLLGIGRRPPFGLDDFEDAYGALATTGALALSGPAQVINEDTVASMSTEELRQKADAQLRRERLR